MSDVNTQFITDLVQSGSFTTSLAVQEAAAEQVNTATTGSTGTDTATTNPAWGKAIPTLIGHTRSVCLPLWTGNPIAAVSSAGDERDSIDFAVYVGNPGPRENAVTLLNIWFDNVLVYSASDASVTTLTGEALKFTFYDGSQVAPDPTIAEAEGAATPAFTNTMYIVFQDLTTRTIDATTTTTQFSKLPQVQVELEQVAATTATGVTIYPFQPPLTSGSSELDGDIHALFYSYRKNQLYCLTDNLFSTFDAGTLQKLGSTALAQFGTGKPFDRGSAMCLTPDGVLVAVTLFDPNWVAYDPISGSITAQTIGKDKNGNNLPAGYGNLYFIGNGYFVIAANFTNFVFFDGAEFIACTLPGWKSLYEGTITVDFAANTSDIPTFKAQTLAYVVSSAQSIRRVIMTPSGDVNTYSQVGVVTADGSNRQIMKPSAVDTVLTLANGESAAAVMCDQHDNTRVYVIVNTPNAGTQLRTYATFYYWNDQNGGTGPETTPAIYGNFDLLTELSRVGIPTPFFNERETYNAFEFRDRRYPEVLYVSGHSWVVLNFKTGSYTQYQPGNYYDPAGNVVGAFSGACRHAIKLGGEIAFLCDTMDFTSVGSDEAGAVAYPAKVIPRAVVSGSTPYSLKNLWEDLCYLARYEYDSITCINMDDTVTGLQLNQTVQFTDLIAQLNTVFRVDMIEQPDGGLLFNRRIDQRSPDFAVTPDLLLPASDDTTGNTVAIDRVASNELPTLLQLSFINEDFGFQVGAATVKRVVFPVQTAFGASFLALSIPVVMSGTDATYYAGLALFDMWSGKMNFQINLPPMFFFIQPGDFVSLTRPSGRTDLCKITEASLGTDRTIAVTLSGVGPIKPLPSYQGALKPGQVPLATLPLSYGTFTTPSPTGVYATVIDNVGIQATDVANTDIPLYLAASAPSDFYIQYGNATPVKLASVVASLMGTVTTALLSTSFPHQDDSAGTFTFTLRNNTVPMPAAEADGFTTVLVGAPGRWEAVGVKALAVAADGVTVTATGLQRGRLGTEPATDGHAPGDAVIFAPTGLARGSVALGQLGSKAKVYAMAPGRPAGATGGVADGLTISGAALAPRSPLFPKAKRQGDGSVVISWYRQDRAQPASFYDDPPMSEATEQYVVTMQTVNGIFAGVRAYTVNARTFNYDTGSQANDGNAKANRYYISIAQISAVVGAGTAWKGYVYVQ